MHSCCVFRGLIVVRVFWPSTANALVSKHSRNSVVRRLFALLAGILSNVSRRRQRCKYLLFVFVAHGVPLWETDLCVVWGVSDVYQIVGGVFVQSLRFIVSVGCGGPYFVSTVVLVDPLGAVCILPIFVVKMAGPGNFHQARCALQQYIFGLLAV